MRYLIPLPLLALSATLAWTAASHSKTATEASAHIPPEARAAAQAGLYAWVNQFIKDGVPLDQDFVLDIETSEQLKSTRIGRGLAMKIVDARQLTAGGTLSQATHGNGQWRFIVMADDDAVGLADVRKTADGYQMIGLGGKQLARNIENRLTLHPGRSASLVRSLQARADYLELSADDTFGAQYLPLSEVAVTTRDADDVAVESPVTDTSNSIDEATLAAELRAAIEHDAKYDAGEEEQSP